MTNYPPEIKLIGQDSVTTDLIFRVIEDGVATHYRVPQVHLRASGLSGPYSNGRLARALLDGRIGSVNNDYLSGEPGSVLRYLAAEDHPPPQTLQNKTLLQYGGAAYGRSTAAEAFDAYYMMKGGHAVDSERYAGYLKSRQAQSAERQRFTEENISMFREFKQYLSENRTWIFTLLLLLAIDSFFLNGALKSRLQRILEVTTTNLEKQLKKDLNGDGTIGEPTE